MDPGARSTRSMSAAATLEAATTLDLTSAAMFVLSATESVANSPGIVSTIVCVHNPHLIGHASANDEPNTVLLQNNEGESSHISSVSAGPAQEGKNVVGVADGVAVLGLVVGVGVGEGVGNNDGTAVGDVGAAVGDVLGWVVGPAVADPVLG